MSIGKTIRHLRNQRQITLRDLASGTGLTPSFLSRLERGMTSVSVSNLRSIALFFNLPLTYFIEEDENRNGAAQVLRSGERRSFQLGSAIGHMQSLVPQNAQHLEAVVITAGPHFDAGHSHPHAGEELTYVIRGKILYYVGEEAHYLGPEDAIFHMGDVPHRWITVGNDEAVVLSIGSYTGH